MTRKTAKLSNRKEVKDPPPGSSSHQLRLRFAELLEGYRPGRIIRVHCDGWPNQRLPAE